MDQEMFWVAVVSAGLALISAGVGCWQAWEARRARKDAKAAQIKAEAAETNATLAEGKAVAARDAAVWAQQESASAAVRIAGVLEQQAEEKRAAAQVRSDPWEVRPGALTNNGKTIVLVNSSGFTLERVSMHVEREPFIVRFSPTPVPSEMKNGEAVELYWARASGSPMTSSLVISWRWADSDVMQETRVPMTR